MGCFQSKETVNICDIILFGRSGCGKSALLNGIAGKNKLLFDSGFTYGDHLTREIQIERIENINLVDTPEALSELDKRTLLSIINNSCNFKLYFVISVSNGIISEWDLKYISDILNMFFSNTNKKIKYNIIFNFVTFNFINNYIKEYINEVNEKIEKNVGYTPDNIEYQKYIPELHTNKYIWKMDSILKNKIIKIS
jgi:GTPase Era involved in 16S rRNA processing